MTAVRRRPSGHITRLVMVALLVAACGATVPPLVTSDPTATRPPVTPAPSTGRFVPTAYPTEGAAPCGEKMAPDGSHATYTGNLKRIAARDAATVVFELCAPDVGFLSKIASPALGINDTGWLTAHIEPTLRGPQAITTDMNGTGPYQLEAWNPGTEVSLARHEGYWGDAAVNERVIVRWNRSSAARVNELQAGTVDGIDEVASTDAANVEADVSMVVAPRAGLDVVYLGFTNTFAPFTSEGVRRALALGIDRGRIVSARLPPAAELATYAAPCSLSYACTGTHWYDFDPTLAKETLAAAGFADGFKTTIRYPADASPSLPDPTAVAIELQTQLSANLGITADLVAEPDSTYRADVDAGKLDGIHILTHAPAYPDVSASLDPRFATGATGEIGRQYDDIAKVPAAGRSTTSGDKREAAYRKANDAIRSHVPIIPIAVLGSDAAFLADVTGAVASPVNQESFARMTPGDRRQLVWLTTSEPAGLYCADETDPVATLVCSQVVESLYTHDVGGAATVPSLAKRCKPDADLVVWTCDLRTGVLFGDGARFDANDVVMSFAAQWDADHPLHLGREGRFETFRSWFGGFLNPPPG